MGTTLFSTGHISELLQQLKNSAKIEIERMNKDQLLNTKEEDLYEYMLKQYTIEAPILLDEQMVALPAEDTNIDVTGHFDYAVLPGDGPCVVKGTAITVAIPFEGDEQLFHFQPSVVFSSGIRGRLVGKEIHLNYQGLPQEMESNSIKKKINDDIGRLKEILNSMAHDMKVHNKFMESEIKGIITKRKKKILDDQGVVGGLGIPIRRRGDDPGTFSVPVVRKKPVIEMPKPTIQTTKIEPILHETEYEHILELVSRMAIVMERSPQAFRDMDEESLRWQFLVPLNSHYEMSSGETFNYLGKTDILIKYEGQNVFIAECKIWRGPGAFIETINQLLGYKSWRDTKTAIILFNKNENFSAVLLQIPELVKKHSCFEHEILRKSETEFRYLFHHPADTSRRFYLSILAFNVPK